MKVVANNKKANFDYEILEKKEAGLVLKGFEVKSIKSGHISLKGSFVTKKNDELFLTNAKVPIYKYSAQIKNYEETRPRKLLVKKKDIQSLIDKTQVQGLTLVPLSVYIKNGLVKLLFALGKGKKRYDKRETIKKRTSDREIERMMKNRR